MPVKISKVGEGRVVLIAGGGRTYADVASRFVRSERDLDDIVGSPYAKQIVEAVVSCGHLSALEFDYFVFGVEGYSRVCEAQLVRKRMASYMIKSGRAQKCGSRVFSVVLPKSVENFSPVIRISKTERLRLGPEALCRILSDWYSKGVEAGLPEEDLRYLKPQATEFKGVIGMNAHALRDWFMVRCCMNAQAEIRDMAYKMLALCNGVAPDLFEGAGPSCRVLGYCPEGFRQNEACKGRVHQKHDAMRILAEAPKATPGGKFFEKMRESHQSRLTAIAVVEKAVRLKASVDEMSREDKAGNPGLVEDARRWLDSALRAAREGRAEDGMEWVSLAETRIRAVIRDGKEEGR